MRSVFILLFIFVVTNSYSFSKSDSTRSKLTISGNVSINSNGIASIPAFSLDKPALIAAFTLSKKRFSYDPTVSYGFNLRPWIIDNWLHYRIIYRPLFELRTGVDFSMFFSEYKTAEEKILQGQQYLTFEIAAIFKLSPRNAISIMYWNDNGQDPGSIKGSFYNLVYDQSDIHIGKSLLLSANVLFFYIDYTGKNDGLFLSPKIAASLVNLPFSVFLQATQAITSNVEPFPGFRWNVGIAYIF